MGSGVPLPHKGSYANRRKLLKQSACFKDPGDIAARNGNFISVIAVARAVDVSARRNVHNKHDMPAIVCQNQVSGLHGTCLRRAADVSDVILILEVRAQVFDVDKGCRAVAPLRCRRNSSIFQNLRAEIGTILSRIIVVFTISGIPIRLGIAICSVEREKRRR